MLFILNNAPCSGLDRDGVFPAADGGEPGQEGGGPGGLHRQHGAQGDGAGPRHPGVQHAGVLLCAVQTLLKLF